MKWCLITGASSGIGAACAEQILEVAKKQGLGIWLLARRYDRILKLSEKLNRDGVVVKCTQLDLSDHHQLSHFLENEKLNLQQVQILINNAGLALGAQPLPAGEWQDWQTMLNTNVLSVLRLTQAVLFGMKERQNGHLFLVGSVAGKWPYAGGNVYAGTKAAIHMLAQSIRLDLLGTGIRLTEILPGMVETEFSMVRLKNETQAKQVYQGMQPLTAEDIARNIAWCAAQPHHVNIQELVIYPTDQAAPGQVSRK